MKRFFQLTLLGIMSIFTCAIAQVSSSKWQSHPIAIDGDAEDWETSPRFFNSDSKIQYEFRNDDMNLYLILKTTDDVMQKQLMLAGFNLRFKVKTKQKITASIVFPGKEGGIESQKGKRSNKSDFSQNDRPSIELVERLDTDERMRPREIALLDGFLFSKDTITSNADTENNIRFTNRGGKESSIYEFSIPLREFFGADYSLENISTIPILLQVVINGKTESGRNSSSQGGSRSSGMGGGSGGGPGGGSGGGSGGGPGGGSGGGPNGGSGGGGDEMGGTPPSGSNMPDAMSMEKKSFKISFYLFANKK